MARASLAKHSGVAGIRKQAEREWGRDVWTGHQGLEKVGVWTQTCRVELGRSREVGADDPGPELGTRWGLLCVKGRDGTHAGHK